MSRSVYLLDVLHVGVRHAVHDRLQPALVRLLREGGSHAVDAAVVRDEAALPQQVLANLPVVHADGRVPTANGATVAVHAVADQGVAPRVLFLELLAFLEVPDLEGVVRGTREDDVLLQHRNGHQGIVMAHDALQALHVLNVSNVPDDNGSIVGGRGYPRALPADKNHVPDRRPSLGHLPLAADLLAEAEMAHVHAETPHGVNVPKADRRVVGARDEDVVPEVQ
mmetsp:Transcript_85805/g.255821  ORF Transcript_85805/g.255821 Transcript_85805/m.255821 type:complete len:224 (-) Transcript_85805:756-1427(-)